MKNNFVVPENKEIGTLLTHVIADDKDLVNQPSLRQVDVSMHFIEKYKNYSDRDFNVRKLAVSY